MRAESFTGYGALKLVEVPRPRRADGRVLVRITAAGVTPLDHTILSGRYLRAAAPLILGNEGAGVVEDPGDSVFSEGARVMFTGPYGVAEDGTYSEWIAVRDEDLCVIPDTIDDATAGGMPVAYLTAQITLTQAGFEPGKTVLAPAIGGAVGNAVTQLARAQGATKAISTTTKPAKAEQARALGFDNVIDLSAESLTDGVARLTGRRGVDVVIDSVGGALTGHALVRLDVGAPEPVDRLLRVADDEERAGRGNEAAPVLFHEVFPRQIKEDLRLNRIGVLELVHENGREAPLEIPTH